MNTVIIISTIFGTIVISILLWTVYRLWRRNKDEYDRVEEEIKIDNQFDWAQPSNNTSADGTRNIAGKGRRSWFQRLSRLPRSNASRETLLPRTGGRAGAQLTSAQRQSLRQLKLAGVSVLGCALVPFEGLIALHHSSSERAETVSNLKTGLDLSNGPKSQLRTMDMCRWKENQLRQTTGKQRDVYFRRTNRHSFKAVLTSADTVFIYLVAQLGQLV